MSIPEIKPKIERLDQSTDRLEEDMEDVKDRLTRVEVKQDQHGEMLKDIHKWAGWFFKTIIGSALVALLSFLGKVILGV